MQLRIIPSVNVNFVSGAVRVSDTSWHMGGERAALPPTVAVWVSVGFTGPLVVSASLDPGPGDSAAGYRPPAGFISGGRNNNVISINMLTKCTLIEHPMRFSADLVYMDAH